MRSKLPIFEVLKYMPMNRTYPKGMPFQRPKGVLSQRDPPMPKASLWGGVPGTFGVDLRGGLALEKAKLVMKIIRYWQRLAFAKGIPSET